MRLFFLSAALCIIAGEHSAAAQAPFRLDEALGAPDGLSISGQYRVRYESQDGRFRAGQTGSDQILVQRLLLKAEYDFGGLYIGGEFQDSRQQLADAGSPIGTDDSNAAELLQAYIGYRASDVFQSGDTFDIHAGRLTIDAGSRRLSARNGFRNTINAFTGVEVNWTGAGGTSLQAFYTLPVLREPSDAASLLSNDVDFDNETGNLQFWAAHLSKNNFLGGLTGEVFVFGLHEDDSEARTSRDRNLFTPGIRLLKPPKAGAFDYEIESVYQVGTSSLSTSPNAPLLDHFAHFQHARIGYTFDRAWKTRIRLEYDFASGDSDPTDDRNGRFDTLFGARRFELGPAGIFGPLARSNLNSPGVRIETRPGNRWQLLAGYRAAFLAARRDVLTTAGVQDVMGNSGNLIGHQFETRLRYDLVPSNIRLETGGAYLIDGGFLQNAPNAPQDGDVIYGYAQVSVTF